MRIHFKRGGGVATDKRAHGSGRTGGLTQKKFYEFPRDERKEKVNIKGQPIKRRMAGEGEGPWGEKARRQKSGSLNQGKGKRRRNKEKLKTVTSTSRQGDVSEEKRNKKCD